MSISSEHTLAATTQELPAELNRPFQIIAFDWDATLATSDSQASAPLRNDLERLLHADVSVVVLTEAELPTIEQWFPERGPHKQHLFVLAGRGEEIIGFDGEARPLRIWRQLATNEENRRLLEAARAGGLPRVAITGDVDQQCIGLGDGSIALTGILCALARGREVSHDRILIVADGVVSPTEIRPAARPAMPPTGPPPVLVSLEVEPAMPAHVLPLGGGLSRFQVLLHKQVLLHEQSRLQGEAWQADGHLPARRTKDRSWLLVEEGFNLAREHEIESLLTTANGYVGTRGSLAEGVSLSTPRTFVAGVFGIHPHAGAIPELVTAPDWTYLRIIVDDHPLNMEDGEILEHRRILDMRQGILWREWRCRDPAGRITRLRFMRLTSLADRHIMAQAVSLTPENYNGRVRLERRLPDIAAGGMPLARAAAIAEHKAPASRAVVTEFASPGRGVTVAVAAASRVHSEGTEYHGEEIRVGVETPVKRWELDAELGQTYRLDRLVSIYTSRDVPQPADAAVAHLERLFSDGGIASVVEAHCQAWDQRWRTAEVQIDGDLEAQRALRFAAYHLISTANPEDERVSIGARALTGDSYKGHVFWDTEIYMLPFYIYTHPPTARALLMYRYHTLDGAREKARSLGYRGALYAWESADDGHETTPAMVLSPDGKLIRVLCGELEQHISADVAYGVWHYWQATGDDAFFCEAGAEILLDTARFWASRVHRGEDGCYHIQHVIGPDEYHEAIDDNAYTNLLAQWNLEQGVAVAKLLEGRWPEQARGLFAKLKLSHEEIGSWPAIAERIYTGFDSETGLFEQFRGYFQLKPINLADYEPRTAPMDVLLGRDRTQQCQVVKQSDVIMLFALLWDRFSPEVRVANFHFYEPRTGHGSSLSPAGHSLVAARLGDMPLARRFFHQAAMIDLANNMGNAAGGVHAAALGGLWQAAVMGFGGMMLRPEGLAFLPHLPDAWSRLQFPVQWHGRQLIVTVHHEPRSIEVEQIGGPEGMVVSLIDGPQLTPFPGRRYVIRWQDAGWGVWEEAD
jgi:kojibiose phosphorylase